MHQTISARVNNKLKILSEFMGLRNIETELKGGLLLFVIIFFLRFETF